jgi:hypothetical protein
MPQRLRTLEVGIDLSLNFADDGQVAIYFGDDSSLLGEWRNWDWQFSAGRNLQIVLTRCRFGRPLQA